MQKILLVVHAMDCREQRGRNYRTTKVSWNEVRRIAHEQQPVQQGRCGFILRRCSNSNAYRKLTLRAVAALFLIAVSSASEMRRM